MDDAEGLPTPKPFSKAFFDLYLTEAPFDVEYDLDEEPVEIVLLKRPGYGFQITVSLAVSMVWLDILHPDLNDAHEIAYADHAHPIPDVLRVTEVESFCQGVSVALVPPEDPAELFPEPADVVRQRDQAIARVLLSPFTVPTRANVGRHRTALEECLKLLRFTSAEVQALHRRSFFRVFNVRRGVHWRGQNDRWVVTGEHPYSRRRDLFNFPHQQLIDVVSG